MEIIERNLIIRVSKEVDHYSAQKIKEEFDRYYSGGHVKNVIFDMSEVEFMDSSGIGMIIGRYMSTRYTGGKVMVAAVPDMVDRILELSGVYKIVKKYDSVKQALRSCCN